VESTKKGRLSATSINKTHHLRFGIAAPFNANALSIQTKHFSEVTMEYQTIIL